MLPLPKTHQPISKGQRAWRKVNKLPHQLNSKSVPQPIISTIE